jgi:hypothetical protein
MYDRKWFECKTAVEETDYVERTESKMQDYFQLIRSYSFPTGQWRPFNR